MEMCRPHGGFVELLYVSPNVCMAMRYTENQNLKMFGSCENNSSFCPALPPTFPTGGFHVVLSAQL